MTPSDWIVCPHCGSENAGIVDWRPDDDTTLKCPDCDERQAAEWYDDDIDRLY